MRSKRVVLGRCALLILATTILGGVCVYLQERHVEAKRWREVQKRGGIPRFWESEAAITITLMNPPNSEHRVITDLGGKATKRIERYGFAEDVDVELVSDRKVPALFCLGDSVTFGVLPNPQSYPKLLEGLLLGAGLKWQVVNAGRSGESTYTGLLRLKYRVQEFLPDVIAVGWYAGNEPVEMMREGVYTGPRVKKTSQGWLTLWETGDDLQFVADSDVDRWTRPLLDYIKPRRRSIGANDRQAMAYVTEGSQGAGTLSQRYALYGSTSFISAFRFLRYQDRHADRLEDNLHKFVVRTLAVLRAFRDRAGSSVVYLVLPEAYEVVPDFVTGHPDYEGLRSVLDLDEDDLNIAAFLRRWFIDLLLDEDVSYVDPLQHMRAAAVEGAVFRSWDLHPTLRGNQAIAQGMQEYWVRRK